MTPYLASLLLFATSSPPADTLRQSLAAHSDRMFFWLVVSSVVTGVGVIVEAPAELHELGRWRKLRRLGKPISWKVPITFVGLVLVIGGIIGEGVFEFLSANAETAIRAHDEKVVGDTIIQAGDAKTSADKARVAAAAAVLDAKAAGIAADKATKSSGVAMQKASAVSATAAKAEKSATGALVLASDAKAQVEQVRTNIANVDAKYAPRTLSKIKREILVSLLAKTVHKSIKPISVGWDVSATDGGEYAREIAGAINDPSTGWKARADTASLGDEDKVGVFLAIRDGKSVSGWMVDLEEVLAAAGITTQVAVDKRLPEDEARIFICKKN